MKEYCYNVLLPFNKSGEHPLFFSILSSNETEVIEMMKILSLTIITEVIISKSQKVDNYDCSDINLIKPENKTVTIIENRFNEEVGKTFKFKNGELIDVY